MSAVRLALKSLPDSDGVPESLASKHGLGPLVENHRTSLFEIVMALHGWP